MKILIPNGTSPKNIGDLAILTSLVDLIKRADPKAHMVLHSTDPQLHAIKSFARVEETLYSYVAFSHKDFLVKLGRMFKLILFYLLTRLQLLDQLIPKDNQLYQLFSDYKQADVVLFTGGGYLRSRKGVTQTLNLLMQLFMLHVASVLNKNSLVAPISFGPFAHLWQEKLTARILKNFNLVSVREIISYEKLQKYHLPHLILSCDLALLLSFKKTTKKTKTNRFTLINWFSEARKQTQLEDTYVTALTTFARKHNLVIQPIVQVHAPLFKTEDDVPTVTRVYKRLQHIVQINPPVVLKHVQHGAAVYGKLHILLGMRMHSNIMAAVCRVPFVAVAYEHKTAGIAKTLKMSNYYIEADKITASVLTHRLESVYAHRNTLTKTIKQQLASIRKKEIFLWKNRLQTTV